MESSYLHKAQALAARFPPLLLDAERVAQTVYQGVHGRRRAGAGESFWQFRDYAPGDSAERIDWRQSARSSRVYVREREWEAAQSAHVWADSSGSMDYASAASLPTKRARAELLMLALSSLLLRGGEKVTWLDAANPVTVFGGAGLERIVSRLTETVMRQGRSNSLPLAGRAREGGDQHEQSSSSGGTPPHPSSPARGEEYLGSSLKFHSNLPPLHPISRDAAVILCSDFLMPPDELTQRMRAYAAQRARGVLVHILDPIEESFAFEGRVEMRGCEDEPVLVLPNAAALRDAYRQRLAAHKARVQALAESVGWAYVRHATHDMPHLTLAQIYQNLAADRRE